MTGVGVITPRRPGGAAALVSAMAFTGCGEILAVDEYKTIEPRGDAAVGKAEHPLLPALPDLEGVEGSRRSNCEACAKDACGNERDACLRSDLCKHMLDCQGVCSDPNCLTRCTDTLPRSLAFE